MIAAQQDLEAMFQYGGKFDGRTVSYKSGTAVAFGCNYGNRQSVTGTFLVAQYSNLAQQCGVQGRGCVSFHNSKASYDVDSSAVGFC
jgi:hypothetical protein